MDIGEKIRKFRTEKGLTLLELSRKSGVALATLSRIENNKMTGTLESHIAICNALGIGLPELYQDLSPSNSAPEVHTASDRTEVFVHDKRSVSEMLIPKVLDKKMMPIMIKIGSKGTTHREESKKGVEKFVYVLEGKVNAAIGEKRYSLNKGDTLYFDSSMPHYFENIGASDARLICVISPPML
jgi:transcriptional regulator with XRE-family HTH domain